MSLVRLLNWKWRICRLSTKWQPVPTGYSRGIGPGDDATGDLEEICDYIDRHDVPGRSFDAGRPNEVWVSDITYLSSRSGWLYLVVFIDLFSRRVVGWCVSTSLAHETVLTALSRAVWQRSRV